MSAMESCPVFVVLGMHRSGTSAVAGALVNRGANAGNALLPSTSDNANGYFEDARLVAASDALLARRGSAWDAPGPLPEPLGGADVDAETDALAAVFGELRCAGRPALVKDPRACRLVPEWSRAMAQAGLDPVYLLVLRDPREVAASLAARDGTSAFRAEQLWLEHLLVAERDTRGARRAFLDFAALLARPEAVLDAALAAAGADGLLAGDAAAGTGVDPALRHQVASAGTGGGLADEVFAFVQGLSGTDGKAAGAAEAFDQFHRQWLLRAQVAQDALADARAREALAQAAAARVAGALRGGLALTDVWSPTALLRAPVPRVYWRAEDLEHSENRSCAARRIGHGSGHAVVVGGNGARIDRLRIDPDERAGVFAIAALRVDGVPVPDLAAAVLASNGHVRPSGGEVWLIAVDDDPWIEIAVAPSIAERALRASIEVGFEVRHRGLPELLWTLVEQEALGAARLRALEDGMSGLAAAHGGANAAMIARMDAQAVAQRDAAVDLARALDAQAVAIEALQESVDALGRESAEALGWIRRRTFSYWWRRWRGESPEEAR